MPDTLIDYRALLEDAALLDLTGWCVLRLTGPDTRDFLQGMATQEISRAGPKSAATTLFLTEKGRPLALAWMALDAANEGALVISDDGARDALRPHFERFRIMEDVEFEGPDGMPRLLGVAGPRRIERGESLASELTGAELIHGDPLSFLLLPEGAPADRIPFAADPQAVEAWRLRIGLPRTGVDFTIDRIATELALPQAIDANKGCYVGQEVVARTSVRGQVRRKRVGFRYPAALGLIPPRTELRSGEAAAGYVTSTAPEPGSADALGMGYLITEAREGTDVLAVQENRSTSLRVLDWPL